MVAFGFKKPTILRALLPEPIHAFFQNYCVVSQINMVEWPENLVVMLHLEISKNRQIFQSVTDEINLTNSCGKKSVGCT